MKELQKLFVQTIPPKLLSYETKRMQELIAYYTISIYTPKHCASCFFCSTNLSSVPQSFPENLQQNKIWKRQTPKLLNIFQDGRTTLRLVSLLFMKEWDLHASCNSSASSRIVSAFSVSCIILSISAAAALTISNFFSTSTSLKAAVPDAWLTFPWETVGTCWRGFTFASLGLATTGVLIPEKLLPFIL